MRDRSLAHIIEQVHKLSSSELTRQTDLLAEQEHRQVARLIAHLGEVSSRKLHLKLGYRSLFEYCVKRLGLSEGCTALRIQVCQVCRRHPMILDALAGQRISLTVAGKLAPHLTDDNRERLIADCAGMSKRAAEEYLVHLAAKPAVSPGARKRRVPSLAPARAAGSAEPCQPDLYNFRFAADKGFMDKLERTAEVGGMGDALRNMREVLERTLDEYLERNDPEKRQQRRDKRAAAKATVGESAEPAEPVALEDRRTAERPRTIPTQRRDQLLIRAGHRCEYRSSDGLRCSERSRLTIDHIVPWGLGGSNEAGNLRVLCFAHNRLHADRCFGAEFMDQKIESARSNRRPSGYQPAPAEDPTVGERATRAITGEYGYRARGSACADPSRTTGIDHALPDRPLDREPGWVGNLVRTRFDVSTRHRLRRGGTLEPGRVRPHSPR